MRQNSSVTVLSFTDTWRLAVEKVGKHLVWCVETVEVIVGCSVCTPFPEAPRWKLRLLQMQNHQSAMHKVEGQSH